MKVHLIKRSSIEDFVLINFQCKSSFSEWLTKLKYADWTRPEDIKGTFRTADLLRNGFNRVIFDIAGNNYRMIGTHAAYTKLCRQHKQYNVNVD